MGLSARHVGELVAELRALLRGAELRAVQPLPPRDLLLVLAPADPALGEVLRLRLSADPEAARLALQIAPVKRHEGPADPFFARLEEALGGSHLHELAQVQDDRVVRLAFRRDGAPCGELVAELTGRHANLVLLDRGGRVERVLVPPGAGKAAALRLASGAAYALPAGRRAGPVEPGPPLAEAFAAPPEEGRLARLAPLSARVEAALGARSEERHEEEQRRELVRRLEHRLARARALVAGLEERQRSCAAAERLRQDAELLLAHLSSIPRGAREVELPDAHQPDSPPRRIALDPGLAPRRNAEKLFARYKKLVRTAERLPEELALARSAVGEVEAWLARAADEAPAELSSAAEAAGILTAPPPPPAARARRPEPRRPYISFQGLHGGEIRVGRNARDNDELTFRCARGNDLWLHTADSPGSHVVLRLEKGAEPDPEDLLDAAHLAAHFSPLRGAPRVDVHVARQKEVKKPRKAPAGLVTLAGGKTLRLRVEPERLARLLASRGRPGTGEGAPA
ncbi:MAG TPA: NFACT RNA binding domain-containing protein [Planctomycetota bacterium]